MCSIHFKTTPHLLVSPQLLSLDDLELITLPLHLDTWLCDANVALIAIQQELNSQARFSLPGFELTRSSHTPLMTERQDVLADVQKRG